MGQYVETLGRRHIGNDTPPDDDGEANRFEAQVSFLPGTYSDVSYCLSDMW
jgi:hypothetical protein